MNKHRHFSFFIFLFSFAAFAAQTPPAPLAERDAIMRFFEYRDAGSPALFQKSAAGLRALAADSTPVSKPGDKFRRALAMYLMATYSMDPAALAMAPEALSVDETTRAAYFKDSRAVLDDFASRKKDGAPSWHLFFTALEDGVKAELEQDPAKRKELEDSAFKKLEAAAQKGDKRAKLRLAQILLQRARRQNAKDRLAGEKRALKLLEEAGDFRGGPDADRTAASPSALNLLGKCLERGAGRRDRRGKPLPGPKSALRAYVDAAAAGHPDALYNLFRLKLSGAGAASKDPVGAYADLRAAAELGHPDAMASWGLTLSQGANDTNGTAIVKADAKTGRDFIERGARAGSARGALVLGRALAAEAGDDLEKLRQAAEWLDNAASAGAGGPPAKFEAAKALLAAAPGPDAEMRAAKHLAAAARAGHADAMDLLAECLENGRGIVKSPEDATVWRMRARARRGDVSAASWLKMKLKK